MNNNGGKVFLDKIKFLPVFMMKPHLCPTMNVTHHMHPITAVRHTTSHRAGFPKARPTGDVLDESSGQTPPQKCTPTTTTTRPPPHPLGCHTGSP